MRSIRQLHISTDKLTYRRPLSLRLVSKRLTELRQSPGVRHLRFPFVRFINVEVIQWHWFGQSSSGYR